MNIFWFLKPKVTYQSKINGKITIGLREGNKALFSGNVTQSGGEIKPMWDEVMADFYKRNLKPKQILILGVGGGSVIHTIRHYDKNANILGIEIDPVMKQVANEQFGIKENTKQKIIIADAISYLFKQTKPQSFDLIIVDLYIGPLNPEKGRTKKFLEQLKKVLKPKGTVLFNAHYQQKNVDEYKTFRKKTDAIFTKIEAVFSYPLNRVLQMSG
jgi:spermidine synthase